jgi:hypothetical protein
MLSLKSNKIVMVILAIALFIGLSYKLSAGIKSISNGWHSATQKFELRLQGRK